MTLGAGREVFGFGVNFLCMGSIVGSVVGAVSSFDIFAAGVKASLPSSSSSANESSFFAVFFFFFGGGPVDPVVGVRALYFAN
jgi:hypothetical protein